MKKYFLFTIVFFLSRASAVEAATGVGPVPQPASSGAQQDVSLDLVTLGFQKLAANRRAHYYDLSENKGSSDNPYELLKQMQAQSNLSDMDYLDFTKSDAEKYLDHTVKIHVMMALSAAMLAYDDLYNLHLGIARGRIKKVYGDIDTENWIANKTRSYRLQQSSMELSELYRQIRDEYNERLGNSVRIELDFNPSPEKFSIVVASKDNASPSARLFVGSLDRRLSDPIISNWCLKYNVEKARELKFNIQETDYFIPDPTDKAKSEWVERVQRDCPRMVPPFKFSELIPAGNYRIIASPSGRTSTPAPANGAANVSVDPEAKTMPISYSVRKLESGTVDVRAEYKSSTMPSIGDRLQPLVPIWKSMDVHIGVDERTRRAEGAIAVRTFNRLSPNVAIQGSAELQLRHIADDPNLGTNEFKPPEKGSLQEFLSKDFTFHLGPVFRYRGFQFAVLQDLRYVRRQDFESGGLLGQYLFSFNYVSNRRGNVGLYFTRANVDRPVVKRRQFGQVLIEETYLKVLNQVGMNFNVSAFRKSYLEGSLGYMDSPLRHNLVGGVVRHVVPLSKISLTYEVGLNEDFVGSKDSWRVGAGFRIGAWGRAAPDVPAAAARGGQVAAPMPTSARADGPVPISTAGVSYAQLSRTMRSGNRPPIADAGQDLTDIRPGTRVVLNGTRSSDPDGDALTYDWSQLGGDPVVLEDRSTATPKFIAGNGQAYTFQLIVTDVKGLRSAPSVVAVRTLREQVPVIIQFYADPPEIQPGQASVLVYEVRNAIRVRITGIDRDLPIVGRETVRPTKTTAYTITAYNAVEGSTSATTNVEIKVPAPQVMSFVAEPPSIVVGGSAVLVYETRNAVRVRITAIDRDLPLTGRETVRPAVTTIYTLTAYNAVGDFTSAAVRVEVKPLRPEIITFTAVPRLIRRGESARLSWETRNASRVTLSGNGSKQVVSASGSREVMEPAEYVIEACNSIDECETRRAQVTLYPF